MICERNISSFFKRGPPSLHELYIYAEYPAIVIPVIIPNIPLTTALRADPGCVVKRTGQRSQMMPCYSQRGGTWRQRHVAEPFYFRTRKRRLTCSGRQQQLQCRFSRTQHESASCQGGCGLCVRVSVAVGKSPSVASLMLTCQTRGRYGRSSRRSLTTPWKRVRPAK